MDRTASGASRLKQRVHFPIVSLRSCTKLHCTGTQTLPDNSSREHSQQITELLTEVAITLGHKAKLENKISNMKEETCEMQHKFGETRLKLEQEIEQLKRENFDKEMELSKLKIRLLEEEKTVVNQVSTLKSEIQILNQENEFIRQDFEIQRENLEKKININQNDLRKETDKNVQLQLKVNKYKNKLKNVINYMQQSLQEFKDKQPREIQTQTEKKSLVPVYEIKPSMEELVLTELFFKPCPLPIEVQDLFFKQHQ